jgi:hypothetical protein
MTSFSLPTDYPCIKVVQSFDELITTSFADGVNALCWPRSLPPGFGEVAEALSVGPGITTLTEFQLRDLPVSAAGKAAIEFMLEDQRLLQAHGLEPVLDCVNGYVQPEEPCPVRTDVCSFHADSATDEADTYLCTYHGAASEGLRNDEARRRVDNPQTRAKLLELFGGEEGEDFLEYLTENFFDLHYDALPGARPFSFGQGNLWRVAIEYPGCPVPPCIHRAPDPVPGQRRLLLIS